jgi:hypothetical protein
VIKSPTAIMREREGHNTAARGPKMTFFCGGCGVMRKIVGRGKLVKGGPWCCAICIAVNKEMTCENQ